MTNYEITDMTNPTYNNDIKAAIANGSYNSFEFANDKYYWSAPVRVTARIGYKAIDTSDRSLGFKDTLELDITNSSGGTNGLDCIETAQAMSTLLQEAIELVEAIRADEDAIIALYKTVQEARREAQRKADDERLAKINNDTRIGETRAALIVDQLKLNAKTNGRYRDCVKVRVRGTDSTMTFHSEFHYKRVTFQQGRRFGYAQISRNDLIAEIADMAEVIEIDQQVAA